MKNKIILNNLAIIFAIMVFQVASVYAQKGSTDQSCIENPVNQEVCLEIVTNEYKGYYYFRNVNGGKIPGLDIDYKDTKTFKFKAGKYLIYIGGESSVLFELNANGSLTSQNSIALDTKENRKLKFNTVQIKINPDKFDGLYYFSIFRANDLFQTKGRLCPFTIDGTKIPQSMEDEIKTVCPANRVPQEPVYFVPSLRYWIEPHGVGYSAISFNVEKLNSSNNLGKITNLSSPQSAKLENNGLRFLTQRIKVSTINYSGNFEIGQNLYQWKQISPTKPLYYEVVLNSRTYFQLTGENKDQPLINLLNVVVPKTAFFVVSSTPAVLAFFEFCVVGRDGCN